LSKTLPQALRDTKRGRNGATRSLTFPERRSRAAALASRTGDITVTHSEKPLDFLDGYLPARLGAPTLLTLRTTALLAALLLYAIGLAILYPLAQASVSKSAAEGNDPALMEFVAP
jgi:hypothetical protein